MQEDGSLPVDWFKGDTMPTDLVDVLSDNPDITSQSNLQENDYSIHCGWQGTVVEEDDKVDNIIDVLF